MCVWSDLWKDCRGGLGAELCDWVMVRAVMAVEVLHSCVRRLETGDDAGDERERGHVYIFPSPS